jgi:hypothetical protein
LPHNAIDLEQREGRINRYRGLVIRKKLAESISNDTLFSTIKEGGIWDKMFAIADEMCKDDKSGITPNWHFNGGHSKIERFVPIHHLSKDKEKYQQLLVTLALYRITFGQPRQEELLEAMKNENLSDEELSFLQNELLIDLSPAPAKLSTSLGRASFARP